MMKSFLNKWWAWLGRKPGVHTGFTVVVRPDGSKALVDQAMLEYLKSTAPNPSQESLDAVMAETHRIRIFRGGNSLGSPMQKDVLLDTVEPELITSLGRTMRIVNGSGGHCMCHGNPTIELMGRTDRRLALIRVHHGRSIRWSAWKDDAKLVQGRRLLEWLAEQGVKHPLEDYEADLRLQKANQAQWQRWKAAMPSCLKPLAAQMSNSYGWKVCHPVQAGGRDKPQQEVPAKEIDPAADGSAAIVCALESTYPDGAERVLALFSWYGSGAGPWSGYPAYEGLA